MSRNVYTIADLHLGHENVSKWRGFATLEEHDETIIDNWNSLVHRSDSVWILGDVIMGHESNIDKLGRLNGLNKIVLGNHDTRPSERYLEYVDRLYGAFALKNYILTHIPVHESQFDRFNGNIHGHTHGNSIDDPRYFCVSAEQVGYTPILMAEVREIIRNRT